MTGIELIAAERRRQIEAEGWDSAHDDEHQSGELSLAAACYASPIPLRAQILVPCGCRSAECEHFAGMIWAWRDPWPFDQQWDKREQGDRLRNLTKAGALIAAEIDRLQRQMPPAPVKTPCPHCDGKSEVTIINKITMKSLRFVCPFCTASPAQSLPVEAPEFLKGSEDQEGK